MLLTAIKPAIEKTRTFDETIAMLEATSSKSNSGIYINSDSAMRQATVYACVRVLSEIIAQLDIEVQTKKGGQWITSDMHHIYDLLAEPNAWQTQHDLISTMVAWSEMSGNAYYYKIKTGDGIVRQMMPVESRFVSAEMEKNMSLSYQVDSEYGIHGKFNADRIFHLRNFGTQGFIGLSTISNHREGIGLALQLEKHAVSAYKNGLQSNKWVKTEVPMKGEQLEQFKKDIAAYQGAVSAGKMPIASGWDINEFRGVSATDAQYIESRKMQKEEIATMFLVPLFILNSTENTTWGSGLEQISKSFVRFSLKPRLNRLSQTLVRELVPEKQRMKTRVVFDTDEFTLGSFKERMEGYRSAIESGVLNPNECREMEARNPREGGEEYRQPVNIANEGDQNAIQNAQPPA